MEESTIDVNLGASREGSRTGELPVKNMKYSNLGLCIKLQRCNFSFRFIANISC